MIILLQKTNNSFPKSLKQKGPVFMNKSFARLSIPQGSECVNLPLILEDISSSGNIRPWALFKIANEYLAMAYEDVNSEKMFRLRNCASWLEYQILPDGKKQLVNANFCRVRLCPICQWRRALKTYSQITKIVEAFQEQYFYVFLTLTMKNLSPDSLSDGLDRLIKAFNRFMKYRTITQAVKGFYRGVEVTHNLTENTYHPHIHVLLAVSPKYFKNESYIKHETWVELWKKALQVDYNPMVNVQRVKSKTAKAIAEVAKYTVKPGEVIIPDDWDLTVETVRVLDQAFDNRRFIGFGGVFKEMHKRLNLSDVESDSADLIHEDDTKINEDVDYSVIYAWESGYKQYRLRE